MKKLFFILLTVFVSTQTGIRDGWSKTDSKKTIPFHLKQQEESSSHLSGKQIAQEVETELFQLTNQFRKSKKLSSLDEGSFFEKIARNYSKEMLQRNFFSHFSPEGKSVLDRIVAANKDYEGECGENLHYIQSPGGLTDPKAIALQMMKDWTHSPTHLKNLVSKDYTLLGMGCASDGKKIYCTQVFSSR